MQQHVRLILVQSSNRRSSDGDGKTHGKVHQRVKRGQRIFVRSWGIIKETIYFYYPTGRFCLVDKICRSLTDAAVLTHSTSGVTLIGVEQYDKAMVSPHLTHKGEGYQMVQGSVYEACVSVQL